MTTNEPNPEHLIDIDKIPKSMTQSTAEFVSKILNIPLGKALDATQEFPETKLPSLRTRFYTAKRNKQIPDTFEIEQVEQKDGKHLYIKNVKRRSK